MSKLTAQWFNGRTVSYRYAPHGSKCGDVIRPGHRSFDKVARRRMSGTTRKTVCRQDLCPRDAKFTVELADGLELVTCGLHSPINVQ